MYVYDNLLQQLQETNTILFIITQLLTGGENEICLESGDGTLL